MLRHMIYVLTYTVVTKKMYRKCAFYKNIIQRTVSGCKILGSSEYKTKHDNTVKNGTPGDLVEKHLNTNFNVMIEMCTRKLFAK
jgi:hypothetical protein